MILDLLRQPDESKKTESAEKAEVKVKEIPIKRLVNWFRNFRAEDFKKKIRQLFSRETVLKLQAEGKVVASMLSFFGLLFLFLFEMVWRGISRIKILTKATNKAEQFWQSRLGNKTEKFIESLEVNKTGIKRSFLISLAFRNMRVKRTRSFVTVGGMSLGIAAIVFLVSIGYGLQRVVTNRVARLEELNMADITLGGSTNLKFDTEALRTILNIPKVKEVIPIISTVGRVSFGGGVGEAVVHGVTSSYLDSAGLKRVKGEFFETNQFALNETNIRVAGVSTGWEYERAEYKRRAREIKFNIEPEAVIKLRAEPNLKGEILGYVRRVEGGYTGDEVWGEEFSGSDRGRMGEGEGGEVLGKWVKGPFPIWEKDEKGEWERVLDDGGVQDWRDGYMAEIDEVLINEDATELMGMTRGMVLGETATASAESLTNTVSAASVSATVVGTDDQGIEWITLDDSDASGAAEAKVLTITLPVEAKRQAVVNTSFIELLGLEVDKAVGKKFMVSFVILQSLKPDLDRPAESESSEYEIVAVVDDEAAPIMYVALEDITKLGIDNYSQAKVVVGEQKDLDKVREQIDVLGYKTASVADTVAQIDKLFSTLRAVLATFGLVALIVASLGMFNTLTVSLMERTREVGVMKAMGMKSDEVRELFLAEAMVMGLLGGVFGVLGGILAGKLLSVILSSVSIIKGVGWVDVSYVPAIFIIIVLVLSFTVGVVTGIYPAKRATKISALNALRYE